MNNVSAEGSANDAAGADSGDGALNVDAASFADVSIGIGADAGSAVGGELGLVEDVIDAGFVRDLEETVGGGGVGGIDDSAVSAADSLNLADLVEDEYADEGGSLASFLRFSFDPESNSTIVDVSSTGNVSTEVDQQIVLSGVGDLTAGGHSELSIIASLLSGQLPTDV